MALCVSSGILTFTALSKLMGKLGSLLRRKKSSPSSAKPVPDEKGSDGNVTVVAGDDTKMKVMDAAETNKESLSLTVLEPSGGREKDIGKPDIVPTTSPIGHVDTGSKYYWRSKYKSSSSLEGQRVYFYYPEGTHYIYVLKLVGGKYYVGESRNLTARLMMHFIGHGAKWTKLHKPVAVMQVLEAETKDDEKYKTLEMMKRYGDAVRGSVWRQKHMSSPPEELRAFFTEGRPWKPTDRSPTPA